MYSHLLGTWNLICFKKSHFVDFILARTRVTMNTVNQVANYGVILYLCFHYIFFAIYDASTLTRVGHVDTIFENSTDTTHCGNVD